MNGWELATVYVRRNAQGVIVAVQTSPPIDDSGKEETRLKTETRAPRIDALAEKHKAQDQRRSELRRKAKEETDIERAIRDYAKKRKGVRP